MITEQFRQAMQSPEALVSSAGNDAKISIITSKHPPTLTKKWLIAEDGAPKKESAGNMTQGGVNITSAINTAEMVGLLSGLGHDQALCYGLPERDAPIITSARKEREFANNPKVIARTNKHFHWSDGAGWFMLDYDPINASSPLTRDALLDVLFKTVPILKNAPMVWGVSSSSCIYNADTGEQVTGIKGQRLYILVENAQDIPRAGKALFNRLWLAGHGQYVVSKSGQLLERSVIDASVWQPSRLDFAATPVCVAPLEARRPAPEAINPDAVPLDTVGAIPELSKDELAALTAIKKAARGKGDVEQEVTTARNDWVNERLAEVPEEAREEAAERLRAAVTHKRLFGDFPLIHQSGKTVTVAQLLDDPQKWHSEKFADPLEPEYSNGDKRIAWANLKSGGSPYIISHAHGGITYHLGDDTGAIIEAAFAKLETDDGAMFTPEVIRALATEYDDPPAWFRIYGRLKKYGLAVTVNRAVKVFIKKERFKRRAQAVGLKAATRDGTKPQIKPGVLVNFDPETGEPGRVIESFAARLLQEALRGYLAYSSEAQTWHQFEGTHWEALGSPEAMDEMLLALIEVGAGDLGFTEQYKRGIKALLIGGGHLKLAGGDHKKLPFANGLLHLESRVLEKTAPANALTWCLPYAYKADADCPSIKAWFSQACEGDGELVEFLRAWMAAVLHGRADLQRFLHLKGAGGTGKGVYMRLLTALVGDENKVSTSLEHLEGNRFELASFYNKRLALITETDKYGGSINNLKAITGQDSVRLERKYQQTGSFVFHGLVVMASNESLQVTDHTSGLERRRITVKFNRRATDAEKEAWRRRGGEDAVIHSELPGLVNWLLELSQEDISRIIANPPEAVTNANSEAMRASNPVADWLVDWCVADPSAWTQIGDKREIRDPYNETFFKNKDSRLYPNYLQWSQRANKTPLSVVRFREILVHCCSTMKIDVRAGRKAGGQGLYGLRLKEAGLDDFPRLA